MQTFRYRHNSWFQPFFKEISGWDKISDSYDPLILFQENCMAKTKIENNKLKHKQRLIPNVGSL